MKRGFLVSPMGPLEWAYQPRPPRWASISGICVARAMHCFVKFTTITVSVRVTRMVNTTGD